MNVEESTTWSARNSQDTRSKFTQIGTTQKKIVSLGLANIFIFSIFEDLASYLLRIASNPPVHLVNEYIALQRYIPE